MLKRLKKLFSSQTKETIRIFEETTKIDYDPTIFSSLKILSLTNSQLSYLPPLSVFVNLEVLNLSGNRIKDIESLKDLKKLRIIDLRFNQIEKIPLWVFNSNKTIYWERTNDEQEGIYLDGNPLDYKLIEKIKNYPFQENIVPFVHEKKEEQSTISIEAEKLIALNRQRITIIQPKSFVSNFVNTFSSNQKSELKLNIFTIEYDNKYNILNQGLSQEFKYIILILKETECCLHPPILELLSELHSKSKIFIIIENSDKSNIEDKMTFFKAYTKSINIIDVYHSFDKNSNESIKKKIYNYLEETHEANSLWKKNWIELRDEVEQSSPSTIDHESFQLLAEKHSLSLNIRDDIFKYLKRVGSI